MKNILRILSFISLLTLLPGQAVLAEEVAEGITEGIYEVKAASSVNVRSGPGVDFKVISTAKPGEEVMIFGIENGWGMTLIGYERGYIAEQFLVRIRDFAKAAEPSPLMEIIRQNTYLNYILGKGHVPSQLWELSGWSTFFIMLGVTIVAGLLMMLVSFIGRNSYVYDYWPVLLIGMFFGAINGYFDSFSFRMTIIPGLVLIVYLFVCVLSHRRIEAYKWYYVPLRILAYGLVLLLTLLAYKSSFLHFGNLSWFWGLAQLFLLFLATARFVVYSFGEFEPYIEPEKRVKRGRVRTLYSDGPVRLLRDSAGDMWYRGISRIRPYEEREDCAGVLVSEGKGYSLFRTPYSDQYVLCVGTDSYDYAEKPSRSNARRRISLSEDLPVSDSGSREDIQQIIYNLESDVLSLERDIDSYEAELESSRIKLDYASGREIDSTYSSFQKSSDIDMYQSQMRDARGKINSAQQDIRSLRGEINQLEVSKELANK